MIIPEHTLPTHDSKRIPLLFNGTDGSLLEPLGIELITDLSYIEGNILPLHNLQNT